MRRLYPLLMLMLLLLPSCGTFSNLSDAIAKGREIATDLRDTYREIKPVADDLIDSGKEIADDVKDAMKIYEGLKDELSATRDELKALDKEAFEKADKDGDGELDWMERLMYLALLGGGSLEIGRRKLKSLKEKAAQAGQ